MKAECSPVDRETQVQAWFWVCLCVEPPPNQSVVFCFFVSDRLCACHVSKPSAQDLLRCKPRELEACQIIRYQAGLRLAELKGKRRLDQCSILLAAKHRGKTMVRFSHFTCPNDLANKGII